MEVTYQNFPLFLEDFKANLPKSRLLSFDFEMTGIATSPSELWWDLPFERYAKMRNSANKYNIIQVGLTLFIPKICEQIDCPSKDHYEVRPYNIYVFPRVNSEFSPQINCDASAMEFNTSHKMNWQKWIEDGVTYIPKKTCKKILEKIMKEKEESQQDEDSFSFSESQKKIIDENLGKLEKWINEEDSQSFSILENNGYKRGFYYCYLEKHHREMTCDTVRKGNDSYFQVMRLSEAETKKYFEEKRRLKLEKFELEKGFTQVFELISESKIPLVGHNCFFDVLFWMRHFHSLLDSSYQKFKQKFNKYFPKLYDTKYIGNNCFLRQEFEKGSSLSDYHKSILQGKLKTDSIELIIPPGFEGYTLDLPEEESQKMQEIIEKKQEKVGRYHEAGFDSFLTGIAFLHFEKLLNMKNFESAYLNKINLVACFFNVNFEGLDEIKPRSFIFVINEPNKLKDFKKVFRDIESNFSAIAESVWLRVSYYENDHPIFVSYKQSESKEISEDLANYFNINKNREIFLNILFKLKKDGLNIVSFQKFIENKLKGKKKEKDDPFDF